MPDLRLAAARAQELPADDDELEEGQSLPSALAGAGDGDSVGGEAGKEAEVLRTKTFFLEPMTQEEALEQVLPYT